MGKREVVTEQPRYIKLNARDNVAIVVNDCGLPTGSRFACDLELMSFVPTAHKNALSDIAEGAPIVRYGKTIGYAASIISVGFFDDAASIEIYTLPLLDASQI